MKILILGGSGILGNRLVEKISDSFQVISTYNNHKIEHSKSRIVRIKLPDEFDKLVRELKKYLKLSGKRL